MGKKILLADDSITIQKVIELTFSDEDFDVVTVGNGRLALERLADVRPDIVLCDIIMPEKDGYEVCEQIKSSPAWAHVPVLLLTGAFEPFDQERAARAGYDGSLAKPFEPETLIAKVKELLARAPKPAVIPAVATAPPALPPRPTAVPPMAAPPAPSFIAPPPTASGPVAISRTVPPPPPVPPPAASGFIPDEPFPEPEFAPGVPPAPGLGEAERQSLAIPAPSAPVVPTPEDDASTVMFRSSELPWPPGAPRPAAVSAPAPQASRPAPLVTPVFEPEPEEPVRPPEVVEQAPAFETVLEEDLEFGDAGYEPEPEPAEPAAPVHEPLFAPEAAALASGPAPESTTGAFAALVREQFVMPHEEPTTPAAPPAPPAPPVELKPETVRVDHEAGRPAVTPLPPEEAAELETEEVESLEELEPEVHAAAHRAEEPPEETFEEEDLSGIEPEPEPEPAPAPAPASSVVSLPVAPLAATRMAAAPAPVPAPAVVPPPVPAAVAPRAAVVAPPTPVVASPPAPVVAHPAVTSFADVAPAEPEPAPPSSQAAGVAVPVDMVEKIAQRVIAQISEKAVREIAWEVIPDLAEAIIKQEIARLKAELAKL